jgi:outer membrane biosynthesis protein TonB
LSQDRQWIVRNASTDDLEVTLNELGNKYALQIHPAVKNGSQYWVIIGKAFAVSPVEVSEAEPQPVEVATKAEPAEPEPQPAAEPQAEKPVEPEVPTVVTTPDTPEPTAAKAKPEKSKPPKPAKPANKKTPAIVVPEKKD